MRVIYVDAGIGERFMSRCEWNELHYSLRGCLSFEWSEYCLDIRACWATCCEVLSWFRWPNRADLGRYRSLGRLFVIFISKMPQGMFRDLSKSLRFVWAYFNTNGHICIDFSKDWSTWMCDPSKYLSNLKGLLKKCFGRHMGISGQSYEQILGANWWANFRTVRWLIWWCIL